MRRSSVLALLVLLVTAGSVHRPGRARRGSVAGRAYVDRSRPRPGMLRAHGPAVRAFAAVGWGWGGDRRFQHYQHSASGR